jgi:asparagine synthase (glutamine-hydrolysing)
MCGILAIIKTLQTQTSTNLVDVLDSGIPLENRGPDNRIVKIGENYMFVFYRLSIMDTSNLANQPFCINNCVLVCNGEIYNYKELTKEYDLCCQSTSDCEVILRLYLKLGNFNETIDKLDGVFAIVLFDQTKNKLCIARDRIGVRPLFISKSKNNELITSSLVKSLLPLSDPKTIQYIQPNTTYIYDLDYSVPNLEINSITNPILDLSMKNCNTELAINKVKDILFNAVKKRIVCDRPISCLLSGGLDSSLIAALLCKILGHENVRTYSIGMEGSTDLFYSQKVADFLQTNHTVVNFTEKEGLNIIPNIIKTIESYDITTIRASVPMWLVSNYISTHSDDKVVFSGEGADELFCGYLYFHNAPSNLILEKESKRLVKELHKYDVLRSDRTVSDCGLEFREPFLDSVLTEFALNLPGEVKKPQHGYEKYILRKAFEDLLPQEVIWRRKEGFSDGNSSLDRAWKDVIAEYVEPIIDTYDDKKFMSKEQAYYKMIFDREFPDYDLNLPPWMPKWSGDLTDPSGRLIDAFDEFL